MGSVIKTDTWTYSDSTWGDVLTAYNGTSVNSVNGKITSLNGKALAYSYLGLLSSAGSTSFTYDTSGKRLSKTTGGTITNFYYAGNMLVGQKTGSNTLQFFYDVNGDYYGFKYNNVPYNYIKNLQGDVIAIADGSGNILVRYTYDAWGRLISTTDTSSNNIGTINPIRYRSYYYDTETGLYYLNSRYYSPEICRFINADGYVSTGQGVIGNNMFAYCGNNPVNRVDHTGMFWKEVGDFLSNAWNEFKTWAKNTFGAGSSTTATIAKIETPIIPDPSPVTIKTGTKTTQTISKHGDSSKPISVYANKDAKHPIKSSSAGININIVNFTLDLSVGLDDIGISVSLTNGNTTNIFGVKLNLSEFKIGFEGSTAIQLDNTTETAYTNASISGWAIVAAYIFFTQGQYVPSPSYAY